MPQQVGKILAIPMGQNSTSQVDIVIAYCNGLAYLRPCLESIFRNTKAPFRLWLVDDASDEYTKSKVRELTAAHTAEMTLFENQERAGYVKSVNRAIRAGECEVVVILDARTVVTPGWLEAVTESFEADARIAVVNPFSNSADWVGSAVELPEGFAIDEFARRAREAGRGEISDIYTASSYCAALRRRAILEVGLFDDVWDDADFAVRDFCMKAVRKDRRVVGAWGGFVYHYGGEEIEESAAAKRDRKKFVLRWREAYRETQEKRRLQVPEGIAAAILEEKENTSEAAPRGAIGKLVWAVEEYGAGVVAETIGARMFNRIFGKRLLDGPGHILARRLGVSGPDYVDHTPAWLKLRYGKEDKPIGVAKREKPEPAVWANGGGKELRVMYILPSLSIFGGVISVIQIVNRLVLSGVNANVASYQPADEKFLGSMPRYFSPYLFPDRRTMLENFPECDVIVATFWETAYDARTIRQSRPEVKLAYFVQDYEPDFYAPDSELRSAAERSYGLIETKIVKTQWLAKKLGSFGGGVETIPLGLNLDIFYDCEEPAREEAMRVVAAARPTARRNLAGTIEILGEVKRRRPEATIAFYGDIGDRDVPFEFENYGKLDSPEAVAALLNKSQVLLDASLFQGFGRPGLEAMACGTAGVLTNRGGVTEYAEDGRNCRLADPEDVEDNAVKIVELLGSRDLREALAAGGKETVKKYDHRLEGERTEVLLRRLVYGDSPRAREG